MFQKSKVKLGLDLLALLNGDMVQETLDESIRIIANSGISFIRFFNNDRPDMRFENYTQSYWSKLEYVLNLFKQYNIIPIISICGYYNRNINKIKFMDREHIFQKTYEIASAIFSKKNFIIEVANEPKKAPRDFKYEPKKSGMPGQMEKLGEWHNRIASYFESLGFPREQIMGNCIDDPAYPKVPKTADKIIGGLAEYRKSKVPNVIASYHRIHFFEDIKEPTGARRMYKARRLWKYHLSNDGKSATGKKGSGVGVGCPKRNIYINISNKELEILITKISGLVRAGIKGHKISIWYSDLPREYFQYKKNCDLFFDLSKLNRDRLQAMADGYKSIFNKYPENYGKFPEKVKPTPEPKPKPIPPKPKPKPIIKEKTMRKKLDVIWGKLLKTMFKTFWNESIWEQKFSAITIFIVFLILLGIWIF